LVRAAPFVVVEVSILSLPKGSLDFDDDGRKVRQVFDDVSIRNLSKREVGAS